MPTTFDLPSIKSIKKLEGKRVIVRLDLNVPMDGPRILDETRITKALPTLLFLKKSGCRIVAISHLGSYGNISLKEVAHLLGKLIPLEFVPEVIGRNVEKKVNDMKNGTILLLENLRKEKGEMNNDMGFAEALSKFGDIYVNEAFSVSHRPHASIVSLPKLLPSFIGFEFEEELKELSKTFNPKHPFLFILGGAKFCTKLPLIKKYLEIADNVFVGGAIMNSFFKAQGLEVGKSLADDCGEDLNSIRKNKKLILPTDALVNDGEIRKTNKIGKNDFLRDIGPESFEKLKKIISSSKEILFNGPLGTYELGFDKTTKETLSLMAETKAHSVVGGGDTLTLVSRLKIGNKLSFVSNGGGAMVEFLANGTLPGIEAIKKN